MTKYPAQIDNNITLPLVADNFTPVFGETVNRLRNAIVAIENELGVKPSGSYSTVRARLDAIETGLGNLQIINLAGDLGGTLASPKVIGWQGRPISDAAPTVNQVMVWNGIAWVPGDPGNITVNILPTTVVLPHDIQFLSGDGYHNGSSPFRVGAREIDMALYPSSWPDGRTRFLKFKVNLEVTNASTDGYVLLKDVTHNAVIFNSLMTTNSLSSTELETIIESGTTDGYLREDCCDTTMYEVQVYVMGGGVNDYVICRNARIEVTYSSPILVSALVPLALPTDLNFVCGTQVTGFTTPAGMGGRKVDMSLFSSSLPDGRIRSVKFHADVEVSAPGVDGYVHLFDTTHNVVVTGTQFHFTDELATEYTSTLTVGSANGNFRNDVSTRYEARAWMISGSPADRVILNNMRVTITYS